MFGEWLRQQRESRRLTREEFAERIGCSVSALRKFENGERRPSGQIAKLIANALDIPIEEQLTFARVARGELSADRLELTSKLISSSNVSAPKTNLPIPPTPLIGRQDEINELLALLDDPECRLLTLAGPGGIGKTRLAIETATRVQELFIDGTYFVSFASVNLARLIVPVLAEALGFAFENASRVDPKAQLLDYLKEKRILILADNLEQLLNEPGIETFAELLAGAPLFKLLATSREALGLQGEWVFEVRGLPIPDESQTDGFPLGTSLELFIQRARRANVEFNPTPGDLSVIHRICSLLDGTPLAIELAAAWTRTLSCGEIANEIERGLDFLSANARDMPARHRSMRAVFDHSWKLLAKEEQGILMRLAVFRGGFTREAAEQIAGANLSALSSLMTKSLARRSGDHRYDLHELIRQYAAERLADQLPVRDETLQAHARYYVDYFGSRYEALRSQLQRETLAELAAEMGNFRKAWNWSIENHEFARIRQIPAMLWYLYELRTWFEEGELVLSNAALAVDSYSTSIGDADTPALADELKGLAAFFTLRRGDAAASHRVLTSIKPHLPAHTAMNIQLCLGIVCRDLGKFSEARENMAECLKISEAQGDRWFQSMAGQFLGIIAFEMGDQKLAHQRLSDALAIGREVGDPMLIAHALGFLSMALQSLGETADAEKFLRESLALTQRIGYRWGVGNALDGLGVLAQASDLNKALELFTAGIGVYREIGDLRSLVRVLCHQGFALLALEDLTSAQRSFTEALALARKYDYVSYALEALTGFACLMAKQGNHQPALELALNILENPAVLQSTRDRAVKLRAEAGIAGLTRGTSIKPGKPLDLLVEEILTSQGPA